MHLLYIPNTDIDINILNMLHQEFVAFGLLAKRFTTSLHVLYLPLLLLENKSWLFKAK